MMLTVVLVVLSLTSYADAGAFSYNVTEFLVGSSGVWGAWDFCPYNNKTDKFSLNFDSNNGATAINLCCNTNPAYEIGSSGNRGFTETQQSAACESGFNGVRIRQSPTLGVTETEFSCDGSITAVPTPAGFDLPQLQWSEVRNCTAGYKICGIRTRYDTTIGITGFQLACCEDQTILNNEQSDPCGFEDGMCGWETPTYYQIPLIDGDLSTTSGNLSVFINDTEIPNRKFAVSGADGPQGGSRFAYYESFIDYYQAVKDPNLKDVPRTLTSPLYDGTFWASPTFSFWFYAYGYSLGQLYFQVLDASSNVIQNQLLYSTLEHDYIFTSVEKWHYVEFPIASLLSGHDGKFYLRFLIENERNTAVRIQSGDFSLDTMELKYSRVGNCNDPGCHYNATCTPSPNLLTGFTCTCNAGYIGNGKNETDGCIYDNPCVNSNDTCLQLYPENTCTFDSPGNYTCTCGDGFEVSPDGRQCLDINECFNSTTITMNCGNNTVCNNTIGNFTCACAEGYSGDPNNTAVSNIVCDPDGGWTAWSLPADSCSVSCGGGVYNATRNCTNPPPEGFGKPCDGPAVNISLTCNDFLCPDSCPVWKNCTCENVTRMEEGGPLNKDLTYFKGLSPNDLTNAMTKLSKWNQTVVDQVCVDASCDTAVLNSSITSMSNDIQEISDVIDASVVAKLEMREILDCHPANGTSHNEWLWDIFDVLCQYDAFLPNIKEDLTIKKDLLSAELDRCANRTPMRQLLELMYRKW